MAIAVFGDIHGNLEALDAILRHIRRNRRRKKIRDVYFLGDGITFGSDSSACLKLLEKHEVICLAGNHEQRMIRYDSSVAEMTNVGLKHMEYIYHSLDNDDLRFIKSMPLEIKTNIGGRNILFTHYAFNKKGEVKDDPKFFNEQALNEMFDGTGFDAVFLGHSHSRKLIINREGRSYFSVGSSGCVHGDTTYYTLFDVGAAVADNYDIYRIDVKFNRKKFVQKMIERDIPGKTDFAARFFGIEFS